MHCRRRVDDVLTRKRSATRILTRRSNSIKVQGLTSTLSCHSATRCSCSITRPPSHALVTDDHGLAEVADSDHFLPEHQRGKPREYEEVNLGASAYLPPFRPGTGFAARVLREMVERARELHPNEAALYLMTRIPYVQVFANGNKRASKLAANTALLAGGLQPFSFKRALVFVRV